jgi:hypothetical protein
MHIKNLVHQLVHLSSDEAFHDGTRGRSDRAAAIPRTREVVPSPSGLHRAADGQPPVITTSDASLLLLAVCRNVWRHFAERLNTGGVHFTASEFWIPAVLPDDGSHSSLRIRSVSHL